MNQKGITLIQLLILIGIIFVVSTLSKNTPNKISNLSTKQNDSTNSSTETPPKLTPPPVEDDTFTSLERVTQCLNSNTKNTEEESAPEIKTIGRSLKVEGNVPSALKCLQMLADGEEYYALVQFPSPIEEASKAKLTSIGVQLFDYLPQFVYIAKFNSQTVSGSNVNNFTVLRWMGAIHKEDRMQKDLLEGKPNKDWQVDTPGNITLNIRFYEDTSIDKINDLLRQYGGWTIGGKATSRYFRINFPLNQVGKLGEENRIAHIEPYIPAVIY